MDHPRSMALDDANEASLFCAASLHRFGLFVDYAKLEYLILPKSCACCELWSPSIGPIHSELKGIAFFYLAMPLGKIWWDTRRLHAHEVVNMSIKRLVLINPAPTGRECLSSL